MAVKLVFAMIGVITMLYYADVTDDPTLLEIEHVGSSPYGKLSQNINMQFCTLDQIFRGFGQLLPTKDITSSSMNDYVDVKTISADVLDKFGHITVEWGIIDGGPLVTNPQTT